jgi:glyoxylase-like metal-dependent hydrolase (beta-lactamase superfamily II)
MTRPFLSIWVCAALTACAQKTAEQQIIADAANAMGGESRMRAVKTLVIEGEGTNGNLGQDMTMEATSQRFDVSGYRRMVDLTSGRMRVEQTRTPNFAYFQGRAPQKQVLGIADRVAYNIAPNGNASRASEAAARDRTAELYHHPLTIVRAALDAGARLANPRTSGSERVVDVTTGDGVAVTLAIDRGSRLPTRTVTMSDNVNLGDVAVETKFADYQDVGGLKLPAQFTTTTDKYTTATLRATRTQVDAALPDLATPSAAAAAPPGPPPVTVTADELAPGVWFLAGQSHHSVLVEFADHLMLIEAPQNDARTLAVIAKARDLRPNKPLTEVVNTHHHFDHSGGVRAAIAEGLGVITHKANAAYFQEAATRAHTILPDALAKNAKPAKITPVDEEMTLRDAARTLTLYHVEGNPHADTMLMAYLPRERLLVEVDAFSPGSAVQPYTANLIENITRRKLKVDRIVPLHGAVVPYAELLKTQSAAAPANRTQP